MSSDDYELRWPRELLRSELLAALSNAVITPQWRERAEVLLGDAFTTPVLSTDFAGLPTAPMTRDPWSTQDPWDDPPAPTEPPAKQFITELTGRLDAINYEGTHTPYYSQRQAGATTTRLSLNGVATAIRALAVNLDGRGYFEHAFGKDCPDDPADHTPEQAIELRLGRPLPWVPSPEQLAASKTDLFDLIEVLHDLAAFPRSRTFHRWDNCGWHHSDPAASTGRAVYRWSVNRILDRSDLGLRLATEGEDIGRLVATSDPDREQLAAQMATREDPATGDRVRHAMSLFRARSATEHDKRSACIALAGVLEERRALVKVEMMSKDEGALFIIANNFAIRHQSAQQQRDYDPVFLDWVYWLYLVTIELTDRLLDRDPAA